MSKRSTSLLIALSVVVIGAVVFMKSRNNTPTGTDVSGAIGTVDKYRSEQITPKDVVTDNNSPARVGSFAALANDPATLETMGTIMGRLSAQERLSIYSRMDKQMASTILDRATAEERASLLGKATPEERAAILGRM